MTNTDIARPGPLMAGKRGLIMGVANDRSIAWGIARLLAGHGAKLAFTYQGDAFGRRAIPLAKQAGADIIVDCDVTDIKSVDKTFAEIKKAWGGLDFVVHALAFSDRRELAGRYADTTRENFINTMVISCFSFTEVAKRPTILDGFAAWRPRCYTLTFSGATRSVPCYNVMGVAKAALEACARSRYLAADLGVLGLRVNALPAGPMRALAGAAVSDRRMLSTTSATSCPAPHADARRGGRRRALPAVGPGRRRPRRGALRRLRLQHGRGAQPRRPARHGAGRRPDRRRSPSKPPNHPAAARGARRSA